MASVIFLLVRSVHTLKGKRLELSTPNLAHIFYGSHSACIDPEVERLKVKVAGLRKLSQSRGCCCRRGMHTSYDCL